MSPLILGIISLIAKLVELGVNAAKNAHDTHEDVVKKYNDAMDQASKIIDNLKADLAKSDAEFLDQLKAKAAASAPTAPASAPNPAAVLPALKPEP
jgi:hypothetical protein